MQVAGIEFLEHLVDQQEDVDEHGNLHDAAQRHQRAVRDHEPLGHARLDDLVHLGRFHELAQRRRPAGAGPRRALRRWPWPCAAFRRGRKSRRTVRPARGCA